MQNTEIVSAHYNNEILWIHMPGIIKEYPFVSPAYIDFLHQETGQEINIQECLQRNRQWLIHRLQMVNLIIEKHLSPELKQQTGVLVVGSDARLENAPGALPISPLEFSVLSEDPRLNDLVEEVIMYLVMKGEIPAVSSVFEKKNLAPGENVSGFENDPTQPWPDRILDGMYVGGSEEVIVKGLYRVHEEWLVNKKIREKVKDNLKIFLKTCKSGESRKVPHFSLHTGELYFDAAKYVRGLKYGPIRALQAFLTMRQLNTGDFSQVIKAPNNIAEKLLHFYPHAGEVARAYEEALFYYHVQQERHAAGESGNYVIDPQHVVWIIETIVNFIEREIHRSSRE